MVMKRIVIGMVVTCCTWGGVALGQVPGEAASTTQDDAAARQLIEQAAAAIKELDSLRYKGTYAMSLGGNKLSLHVQGTVLMMRNHENRDRWLHRTAGHAKDNDTTTQMEIVIEGSVTKWVDDDKKQVRERLGRVNIPSKTYAKELQIKEITAIEPFATVLKDSKLSLGEDATVGDVLCDVVLVTTRGMTTTWSFGKSDHLPRKSARSMMGMASMILELSELEINPELLDSDFDIQVPPGYELVSQVPKPNTKPLAPTTQGPKTPRERRPGLKVDDLAPKWEIAAADGTTVSLETMRDELVVMWFWGTWSLESPSAADSLQKSLDRFAKKPIRVIALNVKERDNDVAAKFLNDGGYDFTFVADADDLAKRYQVKRYPTMFLIGFDGEIVNIVSGLSADEDLLMEFNEAIVEYFRSHQAAGGDTGTSTSGTQTEG